MVNMLIKTTTVSALDVSDLASNPLNTEDMPSCRLKWRHKYLWVKPSKGNEQSVLPPLRNDQWLVECLQHSAVQAVCLDSHLEKSLIYRWISACEAANQSVLLRLPRIPQFADFKMVRPWWSRVFDQTIAAVTLLLTLPLIVGFFLLSLGVLKHFYVSKKWYVGEYGRLVRAYSFATHEPSCSKQSLSSALAAAFDQRHKLNSILKMVNVLRGETALTGSNWRDLGEVLSLCD